MPQRPRIDTLPTAVRAQLDRKLKAAAHGNLVEIAAWLQAKGYVIGKSAVGEYSKRLRAAGTGKHGAQLLPPPATAPSAAAMRLACLQAAARSAGTTAAVLKRAESFAAWVKSGKVQGPGK